MWFMLLCTVGFLLLGSWFFLRRSSATTTEGRRFGCFEYVIHHIRHTCGHHNMSVVVRFHERLNVEAMRRALESVQKKWVLLQSTVVLEEGRHPAFLKLEHPPPIPLFERDLEDIAQELNEKAPQIARDNSDNPEKEVDLQILQMELNTGFEFGAPLMRCIIYQTKTSDNQTNNREDTDGPRVESVRLVVTIAHDIMDGKSLAIVSSELIGSYREQLRSLREERNGGGTPDTTRTNLAPDSLLITPAVEQVMLPKWLPYWVVFLVHLFRFMAMHNWFVYKNVLSLPHTAKDIPKSVVRPLWHTGVVARTLSAEECSRLFKNAKKHGTTVGSALYAAALYSSLLSIGRNGRIWGVLMVDMRGHLLASSVDQKQRSDKLTLLNDVLSKSAVKLDSLGQYLSTLDMTFDIQMKDAKNPQAFWDVSKNVKQKMHKGFRSGQHLSSLVFAQYLSAFSALHSKFFTTPFPCPTFSLSNLGSLDDTSHPLASVTGALNSSSPTLDDMVFGVSSACSFPFACITAVTFKNELRLMFNYCTNTTDMNAINGLADSFMSILKEAANSDE